MARKKPQPQRLTSPFENWDYEKATNAIDEAFESQTIDVTYNAPDNVIPSAGQAYFPSGREYTHPVIINRKFFQGDHWQNGRGWIGPHPENGSDSFQSTMQEIFNIFTAKNVVRECTLRHALGVVGRTMQVGFAPIDSTDDPNGEPPEEIQALMREAMKLIRPWLQSRKVTTLLKDAICTLLLSERAGIQLVIPPGLATEENGKLVIRASTIAEALSLIYPEHPLPENAAVVSDCDTRKEAGVWQYTSKDEDDEETDYVALCYVDTDGKTVTRVFEEGSDEQIQSSLDLGGRIPMFEMHRPVLITTQVQQQQRALNLAESMIPRSSVTSGFLERLLIDAQLPGEPEVDADGKETGRWVEKPFYVGAGTTNFVQSSEYVDEEGKIKRANAKVTYREPTAPTGPITASDKHYRSILDEVGQLHVILAGDSNPSGTSRLNSRIEYLATLQLTQGEVEAAVRFLIDTALAMAEALAQTPGKFTKLIRSQVACRLDAGPLLPAERTAVESSIGKTISQETAMILVGVEDVEAERARMAGDSLSRASYGSAVGDALNKLTACGMTLEGAAEFIGLTPEQVQTIMGGEPGKLQGKSNGEPTGSKDQKKPAELPSPNTRGKGKGGPEKKPLPQPPTSSVGNRGIQN